MLNEFNWAPSPKHEDLGSRKENSKKVEELSEFEFLLKKKAEGLSI
jgi:hypothetical protein